MSDDIDRTEEYLELIAEGDRRATAAANGQHADDPGPQPPDDDPYRDRARSRRRQGRRVVVGEHEQHGGAAVLPGRPSRASAARR